MIKSKIRLYIATISLFLTQVSIFISGVQVDEFTTGFGWPLKFLLYFNADGYKSIFYVLKHMHITSISYRIEIFILNCIIYYYTILFLIKKLKEWKASSYN